jgi:hypothetical protein
MKAQLSHNPQNTALAIMGMAVYWHAKAGEEA